MTTDRPGNARHETSDKILFLHVHYNLPGVWDEEQLHYYRSRDIEKLRNTLHTTIDHLLDLFSGSWELGECFALCDYPSPEDSLDDEEKAVFRSGVSSDDLTDNLDDLWGSDTFSGYRALILHKIRTGLIEDFRAAVDLFNMVMECGISADSCTKAYCQVTLEDAGDFAPRFLEWLSRDESFTANRLILDVLRRQVDRPGWPRDDLDLGKFLLLVDYYASILEERYG